MSSVDSQSSGRSSHSSGYVPDNEEEKEDTKEQIEKEVKEEVEQPGSGVLLSYLCPDLCLEASEVEKIRKDDTKKLLENKKLILILNLDYTLINSVLLEDLTDTEKHLLDVDRSPDYLLHMFHEHCMLTKLRPFIRKFLKKANNMFEMYLFTTRQHDFLEEVVALVDPDNLYFPYRIISRPDNTTRIKMGLDAELRVESVMIILDDNEIVWEDYKDNLIVLEEYNFFAYSVKELGPGFKSLSEQGEDESTSGRTFRSILDVLKRIHDCFYDPELEVDLGSRDVRVILDSLKKSILGGCNIVFSEVFPSNVRPDEQRIWKLAESMGAICLTDVNDSVTHVVAADPNTESAFWARENSKFLVTTHWIVAAHYLWKRQEEEKFPVKHNID